MLISFTGAQSTGKSTLLNKMVSDSSYRKCSFIKEVTRKVARNGLNINEQGDNVTQLFILNEHLNNHHLNGNAILDRCILDGFIYTKYLHDINKVDDWVLEYSINMFKLLAPKLDIIFYTDPTDIPIEDDNIRSLNPVFRDYIINEYNNLLFENNSKIPDILSGCDELLNTIRSKTIKLNGSVSERYKTIITNLKFL